MRLPGHHVHTCKTTGRGNRFGCPICPRRSYFPRVYTGDAMCNVLCFMGAILLTYFINEPRGRSAVEIHMGLSAPVRCAAPPYLPRFRGPPIFPLLSLPRDPLCPRWRVHVGRSYAWGASAVHVIARPCLSESSPRAPGGWLRRGRYLKSGSGGPHALPRVFKLKTVGEPRAKISASGRFFFEGRCNGFEF